ncbi:MAG TPA: RNA-binding protein, partial [Lachnospiraceae bacterium]|nr:RNA-binding protein [Lachnospiraceae bacterium]
MFTDYLLVDGYNVIFAQNKELYEDNIDAAREDLINKLCNFAGVNKVKVILVFDAYKVVGGEGSVEERSGIYI